MTPEAQQRYNDLDETVRKLSNGSRGDPLIMSDGIVNISKTLQVILASNYVTKDQCLDHKEDILGEVQASKFGWKALAAVITGCATLFGLGYKLIETIWDSSENSVSYITDLFNYFV